MAAALYNQLYPGARAASAGTVVDKPGQTLSDAPAPKTIAAMQELGLDVSGNTRRQLTPRMLTDYDKIIVMAEPENTPDWLEACSYAEFWKIKDPKDTDLPGTREVRDELKERIAKLQEL